MGSAKPIYIDVTEVWLLARKDEEVTGIQRVVLEFTHELCGLGLAVPVVAHPFASGLTVLPPALFDLTDLYDMRRFIEWVGLPPKVRSLDKYRTRPFSLAYHGTVQGLRRAWWQARHRRLMRGASEAGATYILLGSIETNRRSARRIRRLDPGATILALVHDVIPLRMKDEMPGAAAAFMAAYNDLVAAGVQLMAVSNHAREDLLAACAGGLLVPPRQPVTVMPLAAELRAPRDPVSGIVPHPYLLMVGAIEGRKNADMVFAAYRRLIAEGCPLPRLVCAGRLSRTAVAAFGKGGRWACLAGHVSLVDQPDHRTLYGLYKEATALVFPSLYEGWGLPVGEAQWLGTPVLSSSATSLTEAGGMAPVYFDPTDTEALTALLRRLATDAAWLEALRTRTAAARPHLRRWRDCALALHALAAAPDEPGRPAIR